MGGGRSSVLQSRAAGPRPAAGSRKGESEGVLEQLSMARRGSRWSSLHDTCSAPASGKDEDARHGGDEARERFHPRRQGRDSRSLELHPKTLSSYYPPDFKLFDLPNGSQGGRGGFSEGLRSNLSGFANWDLHPLSSKTDFKLSDLPTNRDFNIQTE